MTDWEDLKIKPFQLSEVPADLQWCIYPEEKARGEVFLPETIYRIVLALRWILTYTDPGTEEDFETWKVFWKCDGEYGFETHIFLFREKVEQYASWIDEFRVLQPHTWVRLATLSCKNGHGVINEVFIPAAQPYDREYDWRLQGASGVRRLLEDAMLASQATHNTYPISRTGDQTSTYRTSCMQEAGGETLSFKLEGDAYNVKGVSLEVLKRLY